jgi:hypothetical protein
MDHQEGNLIGKVFNKAGEQVKENIFAIEQDGCLVFFTTGRFKLYFKDGSEAKVELGATMTRKDGQEITLIQDNPYVKGFGGYVEDSQRIYMVRSLAENDIAVFHETEEAKFAAHPKELPEGLNWHTWLRGCGKEVRKAVKELMEKENISNYTDKDLIKYLIDKLPKERHNEAEFALIRNNYEHDKRGIELIYGEQDEFFGAAKNNEFSEEIRAVSKTGEEAKPLIKEIGLNKIVHYLQALIIQSQQDVPITALMKKISVPKWVEEIARESNIDNYIALVVRSLLESLRTKGMVFGVVESKGPYYQFKVELEEVGEPLVNAFSEALDTSQSTVQNTDLSETIAGNTGRLLAIFHNNGFVANYANPGQFVVDREGNVRRIDLGDVYIYNPELVEDLISIKEDVILIAEDLEKHLESIAIRRENVPVGSVRREIDALLTGDLSQPLFVIPFAEAYLKHAENLNPKVEKHLRELIQKESGKPGPEKGGGGTFRSLLMMFGVGIIIGMVWPAISKAASSPVVEGFKEASRWDLLGVAGIGLGLIAGGIAINYGVRTFRGWVEQRGVSAVGEKTGEDTEIAFRNAGEIRAELVSTVGEQLMATGIAGSMNRTPAQVIAKADEIVEGFLRRVMPVIEVERQALIKAVTTVPVATIGGEPVDFSEMVLGEVPGREKIQRALLEERGPTLEELLQELLRNRPDYMREVVYFYQRVLIPEGATLSEPEKQFLRQSLVARTLRALHEIAPPEVKVRLNVAAETLAGQIENLREKYGAVLLKKLEQPEKMEELARAVQEEIKTVGLKIEVQPIVNAVKKNSVEELSLPEKEIVLRAVMRAKIWNHGSSIWEVLEQVFGVVPGEAMINEKDIKLSYKSKVNYERLERTIAKNEGKEVFTKSRAMFLVETIAGKSQAEVILNGGYNTLSGMFYRALHELVYAMILNVQGRLPDEGQVNRELAGLINYYLTAGGIPERLDKGVEYTLSPEMIRLIREVPKKGLTEGIIPYLIEAMTALVDRASEISTFEPIAGYEIKPEVMEFQGMKVFALDMQTLFNAKVRFGKVTVEPRNRAVFKVMENIVKVAGKEGKPGKIKFAFVSNVRGLSKEVINQMLIDYMLDYGLSPEVVGQIIDKNLILDRRTLKQTGRRINTKDVYDAVKRALEGGKAEQVSGIELTILTDDPNRWTRKKMEQVLWVILDKPHKGEMLSTATGLVVAVEGGVSSWLKAFIEKNWDKPEVEKLLRILKTEKTFVVPATPLSEKHREYLDRMETEKKIYRVQV